MGKHLDQNYQSEVRLKTYIEMAVRFFLSVKNDEYQKLTDDERQIFDNMYPDLVARDRFINLVSQAADYLTFAAGASVVGHTVAAGLGLMVLSGVLTGIAVGLMAFGIAVSISTVIYREFAVNRKREAILKEGGVQVAFQAFHDLTSGRDEILEQLTDLEHYFDDLGLKLRDEKQSKQDFSLIVSETKKWIQDARALLSDEAVELIKNGILQYRDDSKKPESSEVKLEDVARDLYEQKIHGQVKSVIQDPITQIKNFKKGWRSLTQLSPDDHLDVISKINYDMLYRDYIDNRERIKSSISALCMVADAINSSDPSMIDRVRKSSRSVAEQLRSQSTTFAQEKLVSRHHGKGLSIDVNKLVSGQRTYNPAKIIATGFADLDKVVVKKSSYQRLKKAVSKRLGLSKKH